MVVHTFEKVIEKACIDLDIPGAVLLATNRDGSFNYSKAFGNATVRNDVEKKPMQLDTVMYTGQYKIPLKIASCTKLLTSLSALHLVFSHDLSLDDPTLIKKHLPELIRLPVIQPTAEDGAPRKKPQTRPITLRQLLTHTSGLVYDVLNPLIFAWGQAHHKPPQRGSTVLDRYDTPLAFEPGSSWMYGPSIDYLGLLIERVSGVSLEDYMKMHIWDVLGIKDMAFHLSKRPDMKVRLAEMAYRTAEGKLSDVPESPQRLGYLTPEGNEVSGCLGGEGLFATPEEYIKVLRAVLDTSIIPASLVDEFFKPQLDSAQSNALNSMLQIDFANNAMNGVNKNVRTNWGLGGMLLDADDHPGGRKEGTMVWGGLPMLAWFIDRKTGICGLFATQVLPTGDAKAAELARVFENGMYALKSLGKTRNAHL